MPVIFALLFAAALVVLQYLAIALIAFWNITDILAVGVNFWNIFWLAVASGWLIHASTKDGN